MIDRPGVVSAIGGIINLVDQSWLQAFQYRPFFACFGMRFLRLAKSPAKHERTGIDPEDVATTSRIPVVGTIFTTDMTAVCHIFIPPWPSRFFYESGGQSLHPEFSLWQDHSNQHYPHKKLQYPLRDIGREYHPLRQTKMTGASCS